MQNEGRKKKKKKLKRECQEITTGKMGEKGPSKPPHT
jgi:hypothetical protein